MNGPLFDDLQPRRVVSMNLAAGTATVRDGDELAIMEIWAGASGGLCLRRAVPVPIDQQGERAKVPVSQRWAGVDQV
jgi:hypothetical protein